MDDTTLRKNGVIPDTDDYELCDHRAALHRASFNLDANQFGRDEYEEVRKDNHPTREDIAHEFGDWDTALEAAGCKRTDPSAEYYPKDMMSVVYELHPQVRSGGRCEISKPEYVDCVNCVEEYPSHSTHRSFVGSWSQLLYSCGLPSTRDPSESSNTSKEECLESMQNALEGINYHSLGKYRENKDTGEPCWHVILGHFNSWVNAVKEAGVYVEREGSATEMGENWTEIRLEVLDRDNFECQCCGISDGEAQRKYNTSLHVHHIYKRRWFDSVEHANTKCNLVSLCCSCHKTLEHQPLLDQCKQFSQPITPAYQACSEKVLPEKRDAVKITA
jgi:hypothetical protein